MAFQHHHYGYMALALLAAGGMGATAALAQTANFAPMALSASQSTATADGVTAGIFSMANVAMRDQRGTICTGFADTNPNHILTLEEPVSQLTLQVNSGGNDTTLLLQGPSRDLVYCGEDMGRRNPDAQIQAQNLPAGTYQIWVGSHSQGQRLNYSLTANP